MLESTVAELAATVAILVEASRPMIGGPTAIEIHRAEAAQLAAQRERKAQREAVLSATTKERSAAYLKLDESNRKALLHTMALPARLEFASTLTNAAYDTMIADLAHEAPHVAFALAAPAEPQVIVTTTAPRTDVRTPMGFAISSGQEHVESASAWAQRLDADPELRRMLEGLAASPIHFPHPPRIQVRELTTNEAIHRAIRDWRTGAPLPARAKPSSTRAA